MPMLMVITEVNGKLMLMLMMITEVDCGFLSNLKLGGRTAPCIHGGLNKQKPGLNQQNTWISTVPH